MKAITYNPEKEIMSAIAVLIFSIAILATVNGQQSNTAFAMIATEHQSVSAEVSASSNLMTDEYLESEPSNNVESWMLGRISNSVEEIEVESALQIENWMISDNYLGADIDAEEPLEIENWMISASYFGADIEAEKPLKIEEWMTSNKYFGYSDQAEESEGQLAIEPWMNDPRYWSIANK